MRTEYCDYVLAALRARYFFNFFIFLFFSITILHFKQGHMNSY